MPSRALVVCGVAAVAGAGLWYAKSQGPPACDSQPVLRLVTDALRDRYHLDGIFVNNIGTVSGGWFNDRRECSAQVARIRGNVDASDMPWKEVRFRVDKTADPELPAVNVTMGGAVPLAKPRPSWWQRMVARL